MHNFLTRSPRWTDALILIIFTILLTIHPYYLNNRINVFELGIYLPGINAILHSMVPFRDFFHLRGPLELYAPVWLMKIFGVHMQVLCAYFYVGNVLCLVMIVLIAREFIRSRYIFYMMIPVIIARTYPRVVFMIWGGMRYAFGLMAIFCLIKFLKSRRLWWMAGAGLMSAWAGLISIEMGVYTVAAILGCLLVAWVGRFKPSEETGRGFIYFIGGGFLGLAPWVIYSLQQHAFLPYLDAVMAVVGPKSSVLDSHLVSIYPHNFPEAFAAMINPVHINFRHMTPSYTYLFLLGYLIVRWRKGGREPCELGLWGLGIYGFIMYNTAFRAIWAAQFEMALMPEKVIYFFLVEAFVLWLWSKREAAPDWGRSLIYIFVMGLFIFSCAYTLQRYHKRFWSYQYTLNTLTGKNNDYLKRWDKHEQYGQLNIERARGIWVPVDQYNDLNQISNFITQKTSPDDVIMMFPELGTYNFLFDRPFLGRFPIVTFTWFNDHWFEEYLGDLKSLKTNYIIVQKRMPEDWYKVYLGYAPNKIKYQQMLETIHRFYVPVAQTEATWIYQRK
ncbi:MAG: hypothetical protein HY209_00280 [Candidatus Omnitrophica bacterium]|nr:hypothetical protein [Candidatus Omnitrophota bacterium]